MRAAQLCGAALFVALPFAADGRAPARVFVSVAAPSALVARAGIPADGPLAGVAVAVKDNLETVDLPTTAGAHELRDGRAPRPARDATAVARVRAAGGVVVGKTNLDTWARGVRSVSEVLGQTENAIDRRRSAGGSSGGTAVAVAARLADVGLGSDTCGSLRYPAVYNGVYGLRPTPGVVSRAGLVPLAPTQDAVGPMARTPSALAVVLEVVAGADGRDPLTSSVARPAAGAYVAATAPGASASGMRVGVVDALVRGAAPSMREAARDRLDALRAAGVDVVPVTLPTLAAASVIEDEFLPARALYLAARRAGTDDAPWLRGGLAVRDGRGYAKRLAAGASLRAVLVRLLDEHRLDALAYPTTPFEPAVLGAPQPSANCHLAATAGLPALAVPVARDRFGGIDLLGRPLDEPVLLRLAAAVHDR